jgi:hypothetical protein
MVFLDLGLLLSYTLEMEPASACYLKEDQEEFVNTGTTCLKGTISKDTAELFLNLLGKLASPSQCS